MIQELWVFDFIALFILRVVLGVSLIKEWKNRKDSIKEKFLRVFFITISFLIILGYFSSFTAIFVLVYEILKFLVFKKRDSEILYRIVLALVLIFIGPGDLSFDRFLNVRF